MLAQDHEPHVTIIAILSTLVVTLLFSAVKNRIQEVIDRLFYRERYNSRRVLLRMSQDLNADLDLARMAERLLGGVDAALGVNALALFLPDHDGAFAMFRGVGGARGGTDASACPRTVPWCSGSPAASPCTRRRSRRRSRRRARSTSRTSSPAA